MAHVFSLNGDDWQVRPFMGEEWRWRAAYRPTWQGHGWIAASVPGSVQADAMRAGLIADIYHEMNSLAAEWVPQRAWLYRRNVSVPEEFRGRRVHLLLRGVDYTSTVFWNGEEIGRTEGQFLPASFELTGKLNFDRENVLAVAVDPAPYEQPQIGRTSLVTTQKTRMNYWWDFCPRVVHLGIWDDVLLYASGPARISDVRVRPSISVDLLRAEVEVRVKLDRPMQSAAALHVRITQPNAAGDAPVEVAEDTLALESGASEGILRIRIDQPALWWPNGAGEQVLYEAHVRVDIDGIESDARRVSFGIRRLEWVTNEGAPAGTLPYNVVVNGRRIFIQGWNWVPMDVLYGQERPEKRERLLRLAKAAGVNLLRVWGGGLIEKEDFYVLCDRLGIMVWQEFIQSSSGVDNVPPETPEFIARLTRVAEAAVRARRNHPALAVWSGGNELHYSPDRLCGDEHPALAALKAVVERMDPRRHWVSTSPAGGVFGYEVPKPADDGSALDDEALARRYQDVHGPWEYQGVVAHYRLYNEGRGLLHSEFGVEGLTNRPALDAVIAPEQQWPVSLQNPVWDHAGQWWVKERDWQAAFGPLTSVDDVLRASQFLQASGLGYAVEAERRRQFRSGGVMPWQFNEPFPMAACTSAVDYFGEPKPVYYSVARAYRRLSVTARFDRIAWGGAETFRAQIWASNMRGKRAALLQARVVGLSGMEFGALRQAVTLPENGSSALSEVDVPLDTISEDVFLLLLELQDEAGNLLANNQYLFSKTETLAPLLAAATAGVDAQIEKNGDTWQVRLTGGASQTALWCWLQAPKADLRAPGYALFDDNYFCLLPGERRMVTVRWYGVQEGQRVLALSGWNVAERTL